MTEPNPTSVECPVCGEAFDPTAAGGWCTNSECGEWKYEGEDVPDPDDSVATNHDDHVPLDAITGSASDVPTGEDEPRENGEGDRIHEPAGSSEAAGERSSEAQGREAQGREAQGNEADVAGEPEEPRVAVGDNEPVGGGPGENEPVEDEDVEKEPVESEPGESDAETGSSETGSSETGAEPENDADPAGAEGTGAGSSQNEIEDRLDAIDDRLEDVDDSSAGGEGDEGEEDDEDDGETTIECPDCGETLYEENFFIHDCSADATGEPSAEAAEAASAEAAEATSAEAAEAASADVSEQSGTEATEETGATAGGESSADPSGASSPSAECPTCSEAVEPDANFCPNCGEDLERHRQEGATEDSGGAGGAAGAAGAADAEGATASDTAGERHPENLVLRARGREVTVGDGDAVGREFRRILTRTGGDEDDAVRIHRKHVRFVREGGEFDLIDLGENPTAVNGRNLEKGDRRPVGPGDTITLSNVLTAEVEAP